MNTSLYIAKRYLFSKSSNNTINIITKIATTGVIIATMALFIVLSVFSGLKSYNIFFMNTADPDVKVTAVKGKSFLLTNRIKEVLQDTDISDFSTVIEEHVLLDYNNKRIGATIKGVDFNYLNVNKMDTAVVIGEWFNYKAKKAVIIGAGVSNKLSLSTYSFADALKVYVPKPGKGQLSMKSFNTVKTQVVGIFELTETLNNEYIFANIALAQELLGYDKNQISAIEIRLKEDKNAKEIVKNLQAKLGNTFKVQTREQLNAITYKMLNMENLFTYLISTLIVIIALFNVIGAIIMMILDKRENLKTLGNLGLPISKIRKIFTLQGFLLTLFGLVVGLILSSIIIFIQLKFKPIKIRPNLAYPVEFHFINIAIVSATILILGFLAAIIASSRINKKLVT